MPQRLSLAIASKNFFGAERRVLQIARSIMDASGKSVTISLIINSRLEEKMRAVDWACSVLNRLESNRSLIVIPDKISHLTRAQGIVSFATRMLSRDGFHAVFRARPLAYVRAIVGLPSIVELTSSDVARDVAATAPRSVLYKMKAFHCVSETVKETFWTELQKRLGKKGASKVNVTTSTQPYFEVGNVSQVGDENRSSIVSASRFIKRKNVLLFAQAIKLALPQLPSDWRVDVLGQGDEQESIEAELAEHIESGRVFVGYVSNVEERMRRAGIYVSLIEPDNFPSQGVLEAMRMGCALILSDTGQSRRFIREGSHPNGVLVPLDAAAIAGAIVELANDHQKRLQYSRSSIEHLLATFAAGEHVDEMIALHRR